MSKHDEMVLAIEADVVRDRLSQIGPGPLYAASPDCPVPLLVAESMTVRDGKDTRIIAPRSRIETWSEYKQPIAYVVVHRDGLVLCAQRTKKSPEGRLHGKRLIGFGGHISLDDVEGYDGITDPMLKSMYREIREELGMDPRRGYGGEVKFEAILNDESDDVGRYHFALVAFVEADRDWPLPADGELVNFGWFDASMLAFNREAMESWSRILVDDLVSVGGVLPRVSR